MSAYGRFPVFGALRGSVAVIRRNDCFLALERSDGLGIAFPGGLALPWESDEQVLVREIQEETGLHITFYALLFRYTSSDPYPARVSVYRAEAEGELRESWEGIPLWVGVSTLQRQLMANQHLILQRVLQERS